MQKILLILAAVILLGAPSARAQTSEMPVLFDADERLARPDLSTLPRLRVLTTVDFPPFSFVDQTGRLAGFHLDLVREICRELAIEAKCQVQAMPFADLEAALEAGEGEAIAAGIAVTPALRQRFAFSRPYISIPARFARNREVGLEGKAAEALAGRPVGVVRGTVHQAMLASFFPRLKQVAFEDQAGMLDALKRKEVDAVFSDGLRLPFWVAGEGAQGCCTLYDGPYLSERFLGEGMVLMTRRNTPQLAQAFDYALTQLVRKGKLQDIYLRYFPNGFY
ncbi:transporter substrate-binding domain-containing protein [Rhizobium sp. CSW-27]|uniref:transporter substrate-binding domain-containing protein n=1 Tax=Rhizobium sp. CSW-27 TaxID=2839985 RepID=UPI001C023EBA|nr:transporter substrate-binding domain-containing protein [Rhizobium sp. CSW-27]MBT9372028.1 transporter substrate-binding domain-containing protein [Rhizobium sp. CSW-27]